MDQESPKLTFPLQLKTKDLGTNKFTCVKCFPNAKEICQLSDELWLIEWNGEHHLIDDSCLDNEIPNTFFKFPEKPKPYEDGCYWLDSLETIELKLRRFHPDDGYKLVKGLIGWGYDPRGEISLEFFLLNWAGIQIRAWEHANNDNSRI